MEKIKIDKDIKISERSSVTVTEEIPEENSASAMTVSDHADRKDRNLSGCKYTVYDPGPYEIVAQMGEQALTDAQLLAVILRTGTDKTDATGLAKEILSICDPDRGLSGLNKLSVLDMTGIYGIGKVKAAQLRCVCEIARRMGKRTDIKKADFSGPETIADHYMYDLAHLDKERVIAVLLDTRCRFIRDITLSVGGSDFAFINPRDVFCEVLKTGAAAFVLLHNHPSGDPSPSAADMTMTAKIAEGAKLLGVRFLDHIVIGFNCFVSMKAEGIIR